MVEKLLVQELFKESNQQSDVNPSLSGVDLIQKLSQVKNGKTLTKQQLEFLLSHLPFVIKINEDEYSVMSLKTIAQSRQGGAQCFLVIEICSANETEDA